MNDDDADAVLAELAHVVQVEAAALEFERLLHKVLPLVLEPMMDGFARRFEAEIVGLHARIDRLERRLS